MVYPPLLHVLGAGMVISAILSVRLSLLIIPVFATAVAMLRAPEIGSWQAGEEAALLALAGLVGTACVDVFARAGRSVSEAVGRSWQLAEDQARLTQRERAREHWDGLIHDTVLGALSLAARARDRRVPAAARDLANQALAAFRGEGASSSAIDRWQEHARRLGLQARFRVQGHFADPEIREAFVGAVNEALTNVYRHSGQLAVTVSGTLSSGEALIAVTDRGQGFEPERLTRGLGLPTSVVARMRAVGGTAEVRSGPGSGTRVVLAWRPAVELPHRVGMQWQLRRFVPLSVLAWAVLAATLLASHRQWTTSALPAVAAGTVVAIALLTAATTIAPPTGRNATVIVAATVVTTLACVLNTPLAAVPDWRYWYLSALTPAIVAMSYRFSGWSSGWVVLALVATVMAVDAWVGRPFWACLTRPVPVLLAAVLAAQLIRRALAEAWEAVEETTRRDAELRLAVAAEAELDREAEERIDALEQSVGPVLVQLGAGRTLPPGGGAELERLGAAVRDHLAAPELLDARLVGELRSARLRGVDVDVVATSRASVPGPRQDRAVCRRALASILAHAGPGVRIRVVWSPDDVLRSTFAVVGPGLAGLAATIADDAAREPGGAAVAVTDDTDALLVEFTAS